MSHSCQMNKGTLQIIENLFKLTSIRNHLLHIGPNIRSHRAGPSLKIMNILSACDDMNGTNQTATSKVTLNIL